MLEQLKSAKVGKDKKWMYSLVVWVKKNPDASYKRIQNRINLSHNNNKGYFKQYFKGNDLAQKRNLAVAKKNQTKPKALDYQRKLQAQMRIVWNQYKTGMLSKTSTTHIDSKFN